MITPTNIAALLLLSFAAIGVPVAGQGAAAMASCAAAPQTLPQLSLQMARNGRLAAGESACLTMTLRRGEFVRVVIAADSGALRARLLGPQGNPLQVTMVWSFFASLPLAIEAPESGVYFVELSVPTSLSWVQRAPYRVQLLDHESAATRAARRDSLRRDARVAYLREHAQRVRSIAPADTNYTDLAWLQDALRGVRVVMLGEADHGDGSDLLAMTRLTKFLHERMGYDVVAFESGIHSTAAAWHALQTTANPRDAFLKGVFAIWGGTAQAKPLIDYLADRAKSDRPLELAGIDCQFTGTAAATLLTDLQQFLINEHISSVFANNEATPTRILAAVLRGEYRDRRALPSRAEQAQAVEALRTTAAEVERSAKDRTARFWAQVLRSTATQLNGQLNVMRGGEEREYENARDRQMAENLVFLGTAMYPGRKIVVWAATGHVMRSPTSTSEGRRRGYTMGQGVWEALGPASFAIAFTSYNGTTHWLTQPDDIDQDVIPEQHSLFEFESMMNAAGHELAFVNLRHAPENGAWLHKPFTTSAIYLMPEEAEWSKALDGLFFIRTQTPRRKPLRRMTKGGFHDRSTHRQKSSGQGVRCPQPP